MKKRKGLYLAVLMMLFTMVFGMSSMAATKVVTLKNNRLTGVSVKDYDDVVYYKLSVNQTGYLAVFLFKCGREKRTECSALQFQKAATGGRVQYLPLQVK